MRALVLIDIQNDFLPGGALAVPEGDQVIPVANTLISLKGLFFDLVVATQDWHPKNHGSFASNNPGRRVGEMGRLGGVDQVMWPDHCVQGTQGAEFAERLDSKAIDRVFPKGTDPMIDSYSGFFDNGHQRATGLGDYLKTRGVSAVYLVGLATDYCVKFTALDAVALGFQTVVIAEGVRAVDLHPGDGSRAIEELRKADVKILSLSQIKQIR